MISGEMNAAINEQIGQGFAAMLQDAAIAASFDGEALPELARHREREAEVEREPAMRFVGYLLNAGGKITVPTVPTSRGDAASAEEAVQLSLERELTVTRQINGLMDLANEENGHTSRNAREWLVAEQLDEVASAESLLELVRRAGEQGLLGLENALAPSRGTRR